MSELLNQEQITAFLSQHPSWNQCGNALSQIFRFKDYYATIAFVNKVAQIAHETNHHPDLEVSYSTCRVTYSTHSAQGITSKDTQSISLINTIQAGD